MQAPLSMEMSAYSEAKKSEMEFMLSDKASASSEEIIGQITELYDRLYSIAEAGGASENVLKRVNDFIEGGMTSLVHNFSGYIDDEVKELRTFVSLFKTRKNEAIWGEVFTFYFRPAYLEQAPNDLVLEFVKRYWECFLRIEELRRQPAAHEPHYSGRISKIFYEGVFGRNYDEARTYRNPAFVKLFERSSLEVARALPEETSKQIQKWLILPQFG
ncbi:hypothetical protein JQ631_32155 [Bradyrhizobium manausense]|uniref:hypothetical protein n=1 Tax=Bradyrhizobium manausense TaxID=989370 RepID=UPI001BA90CD4|nr:hypothetical protein [Bradyrhizobium manausense]MBR0793759.1 hypothetical protein [Bradyrhizobium manausense]